MTKAQMEAVVAAAQAGGLDTAAATLEAAAALWAPMGVRPEDGVADVVRALRDEAKRLRRHYDEVPRG